MSEQAPINEVVTFGCGCMWMAGPNGRLEFCLSHPPRLDKQEVKSDPAHILLQLIHIIRHFSYNTTQGDGVCLNPWAERELKKLEDQLKEICSNE